MSKYYFILIVVALVLFSASYLFAEGKASLISVKKIWDRAPHSAFTDLERFDGKWFVTFREGAEHVGEDNGVVRILSSVDGETWEPVFVFTQEGIDLRDPMFSVTPDNQLMIVMAGTIFDENWEYVSRKNFMANSKDGKNWTPLETIMDNHEWLWGVTWHQNKAYGVSYKEGEPTRIATLYVSDDGKKYKKITEWALTDNPSETTLRFTDSGEMIALVRTGKYACIGKSRPPYSDWTWNQTREYVGGPNFIILPDQTMWAAGRFVDWSKSTKEDPVFQTILAQMTEKSLTRDLILPSGGDTSYPGMVFHGDVLWMSYYSSHEGKTAIYLAKIKLK